MSDASSAVASVSNGWTPEVEAVVIQFMEDALGWTYVHRREYEDRNRLHLVLYSANLLLTILSSIGTLVSLLYTDKYSWILYIFSGMAIIAVSIAIVDDQMLSLVASAAKHEECMKRWQVIPEHIKFELTRIPAMRGLAGNFMDHLEKDFHKIHNDQPFVRSSVMREWEDLRKSYTAGKKQVFDVSSMSMLTDSKYKVPILHTTQLPAVTGAMRRSNPITQRIGQPPVTSGVVAPDNIVMDSDQLHDVLADISSNQKIIPLESIVIEPITPHVEEHFTGGGPPQYQPCISIQCAFAMTPEEFLRQRYE